MGPRRDEDRSALRTDVRRGMLAGLALALLLGCGSKTDLEYIEEVEDLEIECWEPRPLDIFGRRMFVIDQSGSMRFELSDGRTRWSLVSETLRRALRGVPTTIDIGAKLFPDAESSTCEGGAALSCDVTEEVDLELGPDNGPRLAALMTAAQPCGSTPLAAAVAAASEELVLDGRDEGAMIVITDGAPNCTGTRSTCPACFNTEQAEIELRAARREGYASYIVGVAIERDAVFQDAIGRLARAGGLPRRPPSSPYYDANDESSIQNVLLSLVAGVPSCHLTLLEEPTPFVRNYARVLVGGTLIDRDATRTEGWDWTGRREITIFGDACITAGLEPAAVLQPCAE